MEASTAMGVLAQCVSMLVSQNQYWDCCLHCLLLLSCWITQHGPSAVWNSTAARVSPVPIRPVASAAVSCSCRCPLLQGLIIQVV
jgi:hypothetical protein